MQIQNCTPHEIILVAADGTPLLSLTPSGVLPRVSTTPTVVGSLAVEGHSIPLRRTVLGEVEGLPAQQADVTLVVSRMLAQAAPERTDLVFPDDTVRDDKGRIVGCRALARA